MHRSISTINADIAQSEFGARGQDIVWAVIGVGVNASHPHFAAFENARLPDGLSHMEFKGRSDRCAFEGTALELWRTVREPSDPRGYGTSVAAIIAGQSKREGKRLIGVAPECSLVSFACGATDGGAVTEMILLAALRAVQEINAATTDGPIIHGVIIPLFLSYEPHNYACGYTPVCVECERLVTSGVVVVAPAGNGGHDENTNRPVPFSISDPGNAENAITVGSTHKFLPQEHGSSYFSSRGPTADGRMKPDLLAPGEKIETYFPDAEVDLVATMMRDGTAYAAAHVAGAAAALMSVRRELIGRPVEIKRILMESAVDLGRQRECQGAGLVDVLAAIRYAGKLTGEAVSANLPKAVRVFCSYSRHDEPLWVEFQAHLSAMERAGIIEVWSDRALENGRSWEPLIEENLAKAEIILLLVSSYFLQSDYCYLKELPVAMRRNRAGEARVVPIMLRPVDLVGTEIDTLNILPRGKKPVTTAFADPHQAWADLAAELRLIAMELRGSASR